MEAVEALCATLSSSPTDTKTLEALSIALARCDTALRQNIFEQLVSVLRDGLKSMNASVSSATLSVVCSLFPLCTVTSEHGESQLRSTLVSLTGHGGLFDRLGDRDRVREMACRALLSAGKACIAASALDVSPKDTESPLSLLDSLVRDVGLASKAARVREMVHHRQADE